MTAAQENVPPAGQDREPLPPAGHVAKIKLAPGIDGYLAYGPEGEDVGECYGTRREANDALRRYNDKPESPPTSSDRGSSTLDGVAQFLILFALFALLLVAFDIGIERQADWMAEQYGRAETID